MKPSFKILFISLIFLFAALVPGGAVETGDLLITGDADMSDLNGNHMIVQYGSTVDTNDKRCGTGSIVFDGNGDYLETPSDSAFDLGSADFTMDAWVKFNSQNTDFRSGTIIGRSHSGGASESGMSMCINSTKIILREFSSAYQFRFTSTHNTDITQWNHYAITRQGSTFRAYVNGNLIGEYTNPFTFVDLQYPVNIGAYWDNNEVYTMNGKIDHVRFTKGSALWTQNSFNLTGEGLQYPPSTLWPVPAPKITFTSNKMSVDHAIQESAILTWKIQNPGEGTVTLEPVIGPVDINNGSYPVTPSTPTTYTFTLTIGTFSISKQVHIDVLNGYDSADKFTVDGKVGVGVVSPTQALEVNGTIKAKEIIVTTNGWADYVFDNNYTLQDLDSVEAYIDANRHLPGIPSAKVLGENGLSVSQMLELQMQKIEELTLHMIELNKENKALKERIQALE